MSWWSRRCSSPRDSNRTYVMDSVNLRSKTTFHGVSEIVYPNGQLTGQTRIIRYLCFCTVKRCQEYRWLKSSNTCVGSPEAVPFNRICVVLAHIPSRVMSKPPAVWSRAGVCMPTTVQAFKRAIHLSLNVPNRNIAWELDIMTGALGCTE